MREIRLGMIFFPLVLVNINSLVSWPVRFSIVGIKGYDLLWQSFGGGGEIWMDGWMMLI